MTKEQLLRKLAQTCLDMRCGPTGRDATDDVVRTQRNKTLTFVAETVIGILDGTIVSL